MNTSLHTETVRFDDGDHLTITPTRGHVTITGLLAGEDVTLDLPSEVALEQGFLLCQYAPDALWNLAPTRSERIGNAIIAAASLAQWTRPAPAAQFTETLPRDDGPDYPSTPARIFDSIPGHREGLDVLALIAEDGPLVHIGGACLDTATTRALVAHLEQLTTAADPTPDTTCPPWCDSTTTPGHWTTTSEGAEAIHTRRFGAITVNVCVEAYRDGHTAHSDPEVVIEHDPGTQQVQGETVLATSAAATLAQQLTAAAAFAATLPRV